MSITRVQSKASEDVPSGAPKVHVVTFGCQMNKYDSLLVEGKFKKHGYALTGDPEQADVLLFNTCSVREHAEERVYSWVGELKRRKRENPELVVGVIGCMAQRVGEELFRRAGHVDLLAGTRAFHRLPEMVAELREERERGGAKRKVALSLEDDPDGERAGEPYTGGLAGYLAVMRGCDLNCTFCVVPATRGRVLSRPIAELVAEARWMIDQGARAITLLGQTINSYGEDLPAKSGGRGRQGRPSLADLILALQELDGLERIRLITAHAAYVTPALADAIAGAAKCERFLPLPAQSGSDRILKAMRRGYTTDLYRERIALLRERVRDLELASDWIVGFPGESDADFEASERFLAEIGSAVNYVFKYSPRPSTYAGEHLADDVPEALKAERNQRLLRAAERTQLARMRAKIGQAVRAFVEGRGERGRLHGRTEHGLAIALDGGDELIGTTVTLVPRDATPFGMYGELAPAVSAR